MSPALPQLAQSTTFAILFDIIKGIEILLTFCVKDFQLCLQRKIPRARKKLKFQSFIIFKKEKETELWGWQTCPTYIYVPVTRASSPLFDYIHSTCQPFVLNKHFAVWWFILLFKNNRMKMKMISPVRIRSLSLLWKRLLIVGRLWREM